MYGKEYTVKRSYRMFQRPGRHVTYKFASSTGTPATEDAPAYIQALMDWANEREGTESYHHALVNFYDGPDDYIPFHADDEKSIVPGSTIYSFSFGDCRRFRVQANNKSYEFDLDVPDNTCLAMQGTMQRTCKHAVPKLTASERKQKTDRKRICVTLRQYNP